MKPEYEHIPEYGPWVRLPKGCTWAEKLDGIYGWWSGAEFTTKTGRHIAVPEYVARPVEACSGEIWLGRGRFGELLSVYQDARNAKWKDVSFVPFHLIERRRVTDPFKHLRAITRIGGEGIVIFGPEREVWKLKGRSDAEAVVVRRNRKHSYSVQCVETGATFNLTALTEAKPGQVVTYSYAERFKSGRPREPIMKGIRG